MRENWDELLVEIDRKIVHEALKVPGGLSIL